MILGVFLFFIRTILSLERGSLQISFLRTADRAWSFAVFFWINVYFWTLNASSNLDEGFFVCVLILVQFIPPLLPLQISEFLAIS
jgi:hypothetical protein